VGVSARARARGDPHAPRRCERTCGRALAASRSPPRQVRAQGTQGGWRPRPRPPPPPRHPDARITTPRAHRFAGPRGPHERRHLPRLEPAADVLEDERGLAALQRPAQLAHAAAKAAGGGFGLPPVVGWTGGMGGGLAGARADAPSAVPPPRVRLRDAWPGRAASVAAPRRGGTGAGLTAPTCSVMRMPAPGVQFTVMLAVLPALTS